MAGWTGIVGVLVISVASVATVNAGGVGVSGLQQSAEVRAMWAGLRKGECVCGHAQMQCSDMDM